jgi:hypothetical protein
MLRRVALVRTDVSEVLSAFFIRVKRIGELGTTLAVTNNRRTLPSGEGLGWFVCKDARNAEPRRQVSLGHVPKVLRSR